MYLGVDVGGTHTDAVLVGPDYKTIAAAKAVTKPQVLDSLNEVLDQLSLGQKASDLKRVTVSTTLGLNSVLTGAAPKVGILATGGPGLGLNPQAWGPYFKELPGAQDHRGQVISPLDFSTAVDAAQELAPLVKALVVAAKFGPKNPILEKTMQDAARTVFNGSVTAASSLFGRLNFSRRLNGAVLNAMVLNLYQEFLGALEKSFRQRGLTAEVYALKADGGVMSLTEAKEKPVLALAAGPAASLLGLWALTGSDPEAANKDILMLDMGGTSSDLAILSHGQPLLTPDGLTLAAKPTLVRGLLTHSLALGGDTDLLYANGAFNPQGLRRGPALALDPANAATRPPTLTDAFNVLGWTTIGDPEVSRAAFKALNPNDPAKAAQEAVDAVLGQLKEAYFDFLAQVNEKPVYTISEFLVDWRLNPTEAVILGGPAPTLAPLVAEALGLKATAPANAATANALGAALARPTLEAELYADTAAGTLAIPTLNYQRSIGPRYTLEDAQKELIKALGDDLAQITQAEIFNQVSDYGDSGRVMRVRAQTPPGLINMPY